MRYSENGGERERVSVGKVWKVERLRAGREIKGRVTLGSDR